MDPFDYVAAMFHFPTEWPVSKDAVIKLETTVARSCYKHTNILPRPHTIAANTQHSDSSRDFSWRNYGEILEDDGSRTVMVILVTGYGAIIKWDLITDKRRWRGL